MKLAERIAKLEAQQPAPAQEPFDYEAYIRLSKSLGSADHSMMGPLYIGDRFNPRRFDPIPAPDHCISREQYNAMTWSSAEPCTKWMLDRCAMYGSNSVAVFMDGRISGDTITTDQQRDALATTFEGFDLSDIDTLPDMLTTDFVVRVIETVNCWRSITGKSGSLIRYWEWIDTRSVEGVYRFKQRLAGGSDAKH